MKKVRFGVCTSNFKDVNYLYEIGYDYLEFSLQSIADLNEETFYEIVKECEKSPLKIEVFNGFIRKYKVVGYEVDYEILKKYLNQAITRAYLLGGKVIVFGSGRARNVPVGFPRERAKAQITEFLIMAGEIAQKYDIDIAIENLNKKECNIINTVEEELEYVEKCNMSNIGALADFYHMRLEDESFEILRKVGHNLCHSHIANSHGRVYPIAENEDNYKAFFNMLKEIGYNKRISIEAKLIDKSNYERALKVMKSLSA